MALHSSRRQVKRDSKRTRTRGAGGGGGWIVVLRDAKRDGPTTCVRRRGFAIGLLPFARQGAILLADKEVAMIIIEITVGMLLAFFWAFWIFAFAGWWCGSC
jgi:hypothetical protein